MTREDIMFEKHDGQTIFKLMDWVTALVRENLCSCGQFKQNCECPKWGDEWKAALEDRAENQR